MPGDFNTTLFSDERVRDGIMVPSDLSELEYLVSHLELVDLRYNSVKLTWCNQRQNERRLYCKLDSALVDRLWLELFESSEATFLPPGSSDHSPCLVRIQQLSPRKNHIFKFCDMWIHNRTSLVLCLRHGILKYKAHLCLEWSASSKM